MFRKTKVPVTVMTIILLSSGLMASAQENAPMKITVNDAVRMALSNNPLAKNVRLETEKAVAAGITAWDIPPTAFEMESGQINSLLIDQHLQVSQSFGLPIEYIRKGRSLKQYASVVQAGGEIKIRELIRQTSESYYRWVFHHERLGIIMQKDSLINAFYQAALKRYQAGDLNYLGLVTAENAWRQSALEADREKTDLSIALLDLQKYIHSEALIEPELTTLPVPDISISGDSSVVHRSPLMNMKNEEAKYADKQVAESWTDYYPDLFLGYFNQSIDHKAGLEGWSAGVSVPLWYGAAKGKVRQAKISRDIALNDSEATLAEHYRQLQIIIASIEQLQRSIGNYQRHSLPLAGTIIEQANLSWIRGNISLMEYTFAASEAYDIKLEYASLKLDLIDQVLLFNEGFGQNDF